MSAVLNIELLEAAARDLVQSAIRSKAMSKKWFDVTALNGIDQIFDETAESVARKTREFKLLRNLHCIDFDAMPPQIREAIPELVDLVVEAARTSFAERQVRS